MEAVVRFARNVAPDRDSGLAGNFYPAPLAGQNPFCPDPLADGLTAVYHARPGVPEQKRDTMATAENVIAWIIAGSAWVVILASPIALMIPRSRRWLLRPLRRRMDARRHRAAEQRERELAMAQARRDARTVALEAELDRISYEAPGI